MSYCRTSNSPFYIYSSGEGVVFTGYGTIPDDAIDIFLYKLSQRTEEMKNRINHGKELIDDWVDERDSYI